MYSEKERVPLFKQVCDSSASATEKTQQLAQLMNDSQDSCRYVVLTFADGRGACVKGRDVLPGYSLIRFFLTTAWHCTNGTACRDLYGCRWHELSTLLHRLLINSYNTL